MTSEELINLVMSDEGMQHTESVLKRHPNFHKVNLLAIYNNLVSVLRSFTEDIKITDPFSLDKVIKDGVAIEQTSCELKDEFDFISDALDLIVFKGEHILVILLKGLNRQDVTPFEQYMFGLLPSGNYFLRSVMYFDYKIKFDEAFSPSGTRGFAIDVDEDVMINDRPYQPRFTGLRGTSKQHCVPIQVFIDKRGREDVN